MNGLNRSDTQYYTVTGVVTCHEISWKQRASTSPEVLPQASAGVRAFAPMVTGAMSRVKCRTTADSSCNGHITRCLAERRCDEHPHPSLRSVRHVSGKGGQAAQVEGLTQDVPPACQCTASLG